MTLCIAWRENDNLKLISDSLVNLGSSSSDFGIKVVRVPFNNYGPSDSSSGALLILSGEIGLTFSGLTVVPLMVKEALAEIMFSMQAVPGFHDYGMDGISDLIFRAYEKISDNVCASVGEAGLTCILFGSYCATQQRLRAFRVEINRSFQITKSEVLTSDGDVEVFGSGERAARQRMPVATNEEKLVQLMQDVIDDASVPSVAGNVQYGWFARTRFQPAYQLLKW